jgi:hypothetical protein
VIGAMRVTAGACWLLLGVCQVWPAIAQTSARNWNAEKCERYRASWGEAMTRFGTNGLGEDFLARHAAFLASGCRNRPAVCPRSEQELALADAMTIAAMNAGAASSFVPFACRD